MPTVSVIVPCYSVTPYVAEAIESILAQSYQDLEIIVINDGCPDSVNLERILAPYRERLRYIRQENVGVSAARNTGIRAAASEFVAFLDADDVWEPHYLAEQMAYLASHPETDVVYPDAVYFGEGPLAGRRFMESCPSAGPVTIASLIQERCCVFISVLARRTALLRAGLFDPAMSRAEDFDFWLRILKTGGRIGYHTRPLVRYRKRNTSLSAESLPMLAGQLHAIGKLEHSASLSGEERSAVQEARSRWQAQSRLAEGKTFLREGDYPAAFRALSAAHEQLPSAKLRAILVLLRVAPPLARFVLKRRESAA